MKVHVIKRGCSLEDFLQHKKGTDRAIQVCYCGYLEVDNPMDTDLWDWCNWSCWTNVKPQECEHLLLTHCNSDVSFCIEGTWYSHKMEKFSSFEECYSEMLKPRTKKFWAVWPHDTGLDDNEPIFVTPENIHNYIK